MCRNGKYSGTGALKRIGTLGRGKKKPGRIDFILSGWGRAFAFRHRTINTIDIERFEFYESAYVTKRRKKI